MKKLFLLLATVTAIFTAYGRGLDNEILYTSSDGSIIIPNNSDVFGANIISNLYDAEKEWWVIKFDAPVTSIGEDAFYKCTSLTSVTIPDSVTSIGEDAFCFCSSLKAFYGKFASADNRCLIIDGVLESFAPAGLTEYTIPDSVTSIGENAFYWCTSLKSVTIGDSVTSIGYAAFAICDSLTSVTIGNSVTSIGDYAFYKCRSLKSITIPDSVTSIGDFAFEDCTSLTSVTIGNSVTEIGDYAFEECTRLKSVTIPDSVTWIGGGAFDDCTSLTSVYCKPTTPPSGGSSMFYGNASGRKIYVPRNSVNAYKSATYWSWYASIEGYDF